MAKLFGVDIAGIVEKEIAPGLLDAVLTKTTVGDRTAGSLTSGKAQTTSPFTCKGVITEFKNQYRNGTQVKEGDKKILIIRNTLPPNVTPDMGDTIKIEDVTYTVAAPVTRDPADATYTIQGRL